MVDLVRIYGTELCPYTTSARVIHAQRGHEVDFRDVETNADFLQEMLELGKGSRKIPLIVEGEAVTIGWEGGT